MLLIKSKLLIFVTFLTVSSCYGYTKRIQDRKLRNRSRELQPSQTYLSRDEWEAVIPKRVVCDLPQPISLIILNNTYTSPCDSLAKCTENVKQIQKQFLDLGYNDLRYSFLIDPLGNIYEGLGWYSSVSNNLDERYRSIGFILPEFEIPTTKQIEAAYALFTNGRNANILNETYKFYGPKHLTDALNIEEYMLI